jgi:hypothetical protein
VRTGQKTSAGNGWALDAAGAQSTDTNGHFERRSNGILPFRFWPKPDLPECPLLVRYQGQSRHWASGRQHVRFMNARHSKSPVTKPRLCSRLRSRYARCRSALLNLAGTRQLQVGQIEPATGAPVASGVTDVTPATLATA